jgi:uncharacterized OsmC-like protein
LKITAQLLNNPGHNAVTLTTGSRSHSISIAPKPVGQGSNTNGGELLLLALATCYCNDLYREAAKQGIPINQIEVEVSGEFGAEGEPGETSPTTQKSPRPPPKK